MAGSRQQLGTGKILISKAKQNLCGAQQVILMFCMSLKKWKGITVQMYALRRHAQLAGTVVIIKKNEESNTEFKKMKYIAHKL